MLNMIHCGSFSGNLISYFIVELMSVLSVSAVSLKYEIADEMGLGKTVELLACIFAHRMSSSEVVGNSSHNEMQAEINDRNVLKRLKRERVECECGALSESYKYKGLWVQCDVCDAWQHADCVGFSAKGKTLLSRNDPQEKACKKKRKRNNSEIVEMDGVHICRPCSELIQATESPVATSATLIVCPTPILSQWHGEIIRYSDYPFNFSFLWV